MDLLHALNLGTLQHFSRELVWQMFWNNIWIVRRGRIQQDLVDLSVQGLRAELAVWEDEHRRARPDHKQTQIQKLTAAHVGVPSTRVLKLKATENKYLFYFLLSKLRAVAHLLHKGDVWLEAAVAMNTLLRAMERMPWNLDAAGVQDYLA